MENGRSSPKWGKAGGEPSISVRTNTASESRPAIHDLAQNFVNGKEERKPIEGIVGLKFAVRKSCRIGSSGTDIPGPVTFPSIYYLYASYY